MIRRASYISVLVIFVVVATLLIFRSDQTRTFTYNSVNTIIVPASLKNKINRATKTHENILAVQVLTIHFQRNIRLETFISIDSAELQDIYDRYIQSKIVETPFFDSDPENNKRMLKLINGDFVCVPFRESTAGKLAPAANQFISEVCAIGIPPRNYGEFTGILVIYLKSVPTFEEKNSLYLFARDLSVKIYDANKAPSLYIN